MIAHTPPPPYYAVIFTSVRTNDADGYADTAARMIELANEQPGFLGVESARNAHDDGPLGVTVSYWDSLDAIRNWKCHVEHQLAQERGRADWYETYKPAFAKWNGTTDFKTGSLYRSL